MGLKKTISKYVSIVLISIGVGFYAGTSNYTTKVVQTQTNKYKQDTKVVEKIVEKGDEKTTYRTTIGTTVGTEKKTVTKTTKDNLWIVGLTYPIIGKDKYYIFSLDRKVFSNIYIGVYGTSEAEYGVGLKFAF